MNCINHPDEDAPYQCYRCQSPICVECETKADGRSICPACLAQLRERLAARYEAETRRLNYAGAVLGGLAAGAAAAFAWSQFVVMTGYRIEVGAALLGGLVGYAVLTGAGAKRGRSLQQIGSVLALVGIIFSYFLIFLRTGAQAYQGLTSDASSALGAVYAFPQYLTGLRLLDWVFLAIGTAWAYWMPHVRSLPKQP